MKHHGWKKYFPLVVGKEKQGERPKPDPFPLNHSLTIFAAAGRSFSSKEVAYIGDSVDDMVAAREAGMWAIGVVPPYLDAESHAAVLRDRGAHIVIHDPNDVPDLIASFDEKLAA